MIVTIDLNVIVEVLLGREDREVCEKILTLCKRGRIDGRLPSHALPTIYYVARPKIGNDKALIAIDELNDDLTITPVDNALIRKARSLNISDFEDAIVAASAVESKSDFIITKNSKDFAASPVPAITPERFMRDIDLSFGR